MLGIRRVLRNCGWAFRVRRAHGRVLDNHPRLLPDFNPSYPALFFPAANNSCDFLMASSSFNPGSSSTAVMCPCFITKTVHDDPLSGTHTLRILNRVVLSCQQHSMEGMVRTLPAGQVNGVSIPSKVRG